MLIIALLLILAIIIFLPQLWAKRTFRRYSKEIPSLPGSGAELVEHLLERYKMDGFLVELTDQGDHYDPSSRTVRLSHDNYYGKNLTAIAVATHEFGHAQQHHENFPLLALRTRLVYLAQPAEKIGSIAMLLIPVVALITRSPSAGGLMLLLGVLSMGLSSLVHLITLPVETDASFKRALPLLASGYISEEQLPAVKKVLKAAAFTYLAASLSSIANLGRWISILLRR